MPQCYPENSPRIREQVGFKEESCIDHGRTPSCGAVPAKHRGLFGEIRSAAWEYRLFQQRDDGFASLEPCGRPRGGFLGVKDLGAPPVTGPKAAEMAGPLHNSGLRWSI
jgi:hypothetical protein